MPTRGPLRRSKLATFALTLTLFALAAPDASAQSGGRLQEYSQRWYGQNFYDHQRNGYFSRGSRERQNHISIYGPAVLYSRQYGDEYGYATDRPFARRRVSGGTGYEANSYPR